MIARRFCAMCRTRPCSGARHFCSVACSKQYDAEAHARRVDRVCKNIAREMAPTAKERGR